MVPESNIRVETPNLWIEKFPEGHTVNFPKGLIKRISTNPVKSKGSIIPLHYEKRINIQWYDETPETFDTKMSELIEEVEAAVEVSSDITNATFLTREDGWDPTTVSGN